MVRWYGIDNTFRKTITLGLFLLCLPLAHSTLAQPPAIHGIVTTENYVPIPNAEVIIFKKGVPPFDTLMRTNANYQGYFSVDNLPPVYEYLIWINGTSDLVFPGQFWYLPGNITSTPQTPVYLNDQSVFTVHIQMSRTPANYSDPIEFFIGAIEGNIYSEYGTTMENVKVIANDAYDSTVVFEEAFSDADGHFVMFHLPADVPIFLEFLPPTTSDMPRQFWADHKTTLKPTFQVVVNKFNTYHRDEFKLEKYPDTGNVDTAYGTIEVTLYDQNNNLVMNRCNVSFIGDTSTFNYYRDIGSTDTMMVVPHIREGYYSVYCEVEGFPPQYYHPDMNTSYNNHRFRLNRGEYRELPIHLVNGFDNGKFTGVVETSNGTPIEKAKVCALDTSYFHHGPWINVYNFHTEYMVETNATGNYEISNVRPGTYTLIALTEDGKFIPVFFPNTQQYQAAQRFDINAANFEHKASFKLTPGAPVQGFVQSEAGTPLRNIKANLWENQDNTMPQRNFYYEVFSDVTGRILFPGMPEGRWHIQVWDDSGTYLLKDYHYEDIVTQGTEPVPLETIIMQAGGAFYGKYTLPSNDTNDYHDIGRLFIYPADSLALKGDDDDDFWKYHYIGIHRTEQTGEYKTEAIPPGNWKMIVAPNQHYDPQTNWGDKKFIPSLRWSFIDNAYTLMSTKTMTVVPHKKEYHELNLKDDQGFSIKGIISGEDSTEIFGFDTTTGTQGKYFHIRVFIEDAGHFIPVAESFEIGNNGYILSGLVDGGKYYFNSHSEDYPDQWWIDYPDSASCDPDRAMPYTLNTTNFVMPHIYLQKEPHGYQGNNEGPPPLKNFKIKPVGLSAFHLSWDEPPSADSVVEYRVWRIHDASQTFFKLSDNGEYWDINDSVITEDELDALLDSFVVTNTSFIDLTAKPFVNYMYLAFGINRKGEGEPDLPGEIHISHYFAKINHDTYNTSSTINAGAWHMTGICGYNPVPLINTSGDLQVFYWDEKAESSKLYSHYKPVEVVERGQGVWVYTYNPIDLIMTEPAFNQLVLNQNNIKLELNAGWNQVSSPFPYDVSPPSWPDSIDLWEWDPTINGYKETEVVKPWKAYWVKYPVDTMLALSSKPAMAVKRGKRGLKRYASWELQVSLRGEKSSDPDNFIGTLPVQLSKSMINVATEPPQAFGFPQLFFVKESEKLSKQYLFANTIPEKKLEWVVAVSPSTEDMAIEINGLSSVPQEVGLFWIDKSGIYDLRKINTIPIAAHDATYNGMVLATASPIDLALYSGKYMLKQNYPNPFRSATTIEFTIPYSWDNSGKLSSSRQRIALSVYNVVGQLVSTVYSGSAKVGHYRKVWDGKSNSGRSLPSGMYIARFESTLFTKSMKLFKVK